MHICWCILIFVSLLHILAEIASASKPLFLLTDTFLLKEVNDTDSDYDVLIAEITRNFKYFVSPGLLSDNQLCREDSETFFKEILKGYDSELWAMKLLDASGSFLPHGKLLDNMNLIGNFDDCLDIEWTRAKSKETIRGQHCNYEIQLVNIPEDIERYGPLVTRILERYQQESVFRSICLPSSCNYIDVQKGTDRFLNVTGHASYLTEFSCDMKKEIAFSTGEKFMIAALFILAIFLIGFTSYDVYIRREQKLATLKKIQQLHAHNKHVLTLLPCFSIVNNLEKLFNIKEDKFDFFNGLKFIARIWATVGIMHADIMQSPQRNVKDVYRNFSDWHRNLWLASPNAVDVFLFLSAFMTSYTFSAAVKGRKSLKHIMSVTLKGYLKRYVRLTPAYAFLIAISCTLLVHTASGPFWLEQIHKEITACSRNWWKNLLYLNDIDYSRESKECMPQSWFLAKDMAYTIIAPILLIPLVYNKRIGLMLLMVCCISGLTLPMLLVFYESAYTDTEYSKRNENLFSTAIRKSSPYTLGLLLGYLFYNPPKQRLNTFLVTSCWVLLIPILYVSVFAGLQPLKFTGVELSLSFTYESVAQRPMFIVALAWIVYACCHGYADGLKHFLAWKPLIPLGKLMYSVFLVSYLVQLWLLYSRKENAFYDTGILTFTIITQVILSFVVGLLFYLLVECPLNNVFKLLFEKWFKPEQKIKTG